MATTPPPPYVAVIFTNRQVEGVDDGYDTTAARMVELAQTIDGFLGIESVRDASGTGITVSYWRDHEAVGEWRDHPEHLDAQSAGRREWYAWYELRVATVERAASHRMP
ncbi:MAG: antibiotic biosynthesis monooxygenase [Actinomycetota bacterium]